MSFITNHTQVGDITRIDTCDDESCYVCYEGESSTNPFTISRCACIGSMKIHRTCLITVINNYGPVCLNCRTKYKRRVDVIHHDEGYDSYSEYYMDDTTLRMTYNLSVYTYRDYKLNTISENPYRLEKVYFDVNIPCYDGPFKKYYPDGSLMIDACYDIGLIIGEYNEYYEDGSIKAHKDCNSNMMTTYYRGGMVKETYFIMNKRCQYLIKKGGYHFNNYKIKLYKYAPCGALVKTTVKESTTYYTNGVMKTNYIGHIYHPTGHMAHKYFNYEKSDGIIHQYYYRDGTPKKFYNYYSPCHQTPYIAFSIDFNRDGSLRHVQKCINDDNDNDRGKNRYLYISFKDNKILEMKIQLEDTCGNIFGLEIVLPENYTYYWDEGSMDEINDSIQECYNCPY